jgi:hypothetical protein
MDQGVLLYGKSSADIARGRTLGKQPGNSTSTNKKINVNLSFILSKLCHEILENVYVAIEYE